MTKTALITGASSGIGKELATIHAEKGGNLILVARRKDKLITLKKELEAQHNIKVTTITKDLSIQGSAKELYNEIKATGIQVDYLCNNAGFGFVGKFEEINWETHQQMMNLNMINLTELTYLFLPEMIARNSGKILSTSSTASLIPGPLQAVYYATKAYVTSFSNALDEELRNTNISVTNLMPGATETEFGRKSGMDKTDLFKKTASARKVAEVGYNGMLKGKLDVISGLTTYQKFMLAISPLMPKKVILNIVRKGQEKK